MRRQEKASVAWRRNRRCPVFCFLETSSLPFAYIMNRGDIVSEFEAYINGKYRPHDEKQREHDKKIRNIEKELARFDQAGMTFEQEIETFAEETEIRLKKHAEFPKHP